MDAASPRLQGERAFARKCVRTTLCNDGLSQVMFLDVSMCSSKSVRVFKRLWGLRAQKSQVAIATTFLHRGQLARKFHRKHAIFAPNSQTEEEGRGTRSGYEASKGSKGISGLSSRLSMSLS